jgi:hypothetical protein
MMTSPCTNQQSNANGINVLLPNGGTMTSTHTAELPIAALPLAARTAHLFPALSSGALLSIGQLCDHGCTAIFNQDTVHIQKDNTTILQGQRNPTNGMWCINLPHATDTVIASPITNTTTNAARANNAIEHKTKAGLVAFLHAACFSPAASTFIQAIKAGFFTTWPGLTAELVSKHLPKSDATVKGHLDQQSKNVRSTKAKIPTESPPEEPDFEPSIDKRTNAVFAEIISPTGQIYTDLPGRFPVSSNRGNQYIYILYDYDSNAILAEPMKNRSDRKMV